MPAYDNTAIAAKLELYADLLEIDGVDKYRFLAYRKTANAVRSWPEQMSVLCEQGRLTEVTSVGAKMAGIIAEIIDRGSFADLDALAERIPPGLASIMRVPGVGPKRALQLYDKLGVSDLEQLESALAEGKVERLGGFGSKTAEKIQSSLRAHRLHNERTPIAVALPLAEALVSDIRSLPGVARAEIAGSVRRRAETVGNLDVVVATEDSQAVAEALCSLPAVERVVGRSPDEVAIELHDGFEVTLQLVPPSKFGEALRHFTGSIEHNRRVEDLALRRGVDLAELETAEEDEVFDLLGIEVIAPELREGKESLELAIEGSLPRLVTIADVRSDLQSHSTYTDGKSTLEENRAMAAELGYEYFAATDHAYNLRMVGGLSVEDIERQWAEIDELNANRGALPLILTGIELNIADDGSVDYDDELLGRFDIALASLHSGWDQDEETITQRLLRAIEHPLVDIIAHPTGRILGKRDPMRLDMERIFAAAGETGTVMEINSYPDRLDLSDEHIRLARHCGVRFSLGTDAHAAMHMRFMPFGVAQARRGMVVAGELLNAQPWDVARTWLKRNRG